MKSLSRWGKANVRLTRVIVVLCHLSLLFLAVSLGIQLLNSGIEFPGWVRFAALAIWLFFVLIYPSRKKGVYFRQKLSDYFIAFSTFMMICSVSNRSAVLRSLNEAYAGSTVTEISRPINPKAKEILESLKHRDKKSLTRKEKRILKNEFKNQLGVYIAATLTGKKDEKNNAGLIIITIVVALGLLYLVAALACSLSCNGMDGAAIAVALIGTVGIIWGTIAVIRRIKRGKKKKPEVVEEKQG